MKYVLGTSFEKRRSDIACALVLWRHFFAAKINSTQTHWPFTRGMALPNYDHSTSIVNDGPTLNNSITRTYAGDNRAIALRIIHRKVWPHISRRWTLYISYNLDGNNAIRQHPRDDDHSSRVSRDRVSGRLPYSKSEDTHE